LKAGPCSEAKLQLVGGTASASRAAAVPTSVSIEVCQSASGAAEFPRGRLDDGTPLGPELHPQTSKVCARTIARLGGKTYENAAVLARAELGEEVGDPLEGQRERRG
jgi:hypothetical protein